MERKWRSCALGGGGREGRRSAKTTDADDEDEELEADLGERAASIKTDMPRGPFQVPFGAFIPVEVDGFLPAEKNLSMSRLVSGALRLQPISMHTGQAAGTLAALAVLEDLPPRKIDPRLVQRHLLEAGSALSLCEYNDVPRDHPFWPGVQMANMVSVEGVNPMKLTALLSFAVPDLPAIVLPIALER